MAWIESHTTLRANKKLKPLCDDLGISRAQAIGHLHMLWWWTIEHREDGDLSSLFPRDIADACDWTGKPDTLIKALKKRGWMTQDMKIKDWMQYAGRLIRERERGRVRRMSSDASADGPRVKPRLPNQTEPNQTVKTGLLFTDNEKRMILEDIAKAREITPNSEAAEVRFTEICREIGRVKSVDNALALARHKARHQA